MTNTNKKLDFIGVLIFEILMLVVQIYIFQISIEGYLNSNFNVPPIGYVHPLESTGVIISFIAIPIFLSFFTAFSIIFQIIKKNLYGLLLFLVISASLVLAFSWLMHGIPLYSFLLSLVSFALCSFGCSRMWISRETLHKSAHQRVQTLNQDEPTKPLD